jgi:prevent-host-death family protein
MDARSSDLGVADAKARFSELVARAEAGETITIRRHGRVVAKLIPAQGPPLSADERRKAHEDWIAYRDARDIRLGAGLTIRQLIEEGRRS